MQRPGGCGLSDLLPGGHRRLRQGGQREPGSCGSGQGLARGELRQRTDRTCRCASRFCEAIEKLRWLFAGNLDLLVLNLEPSATSLPVELREPAEEWAVVRRFLDVTNGSKNKSNDSAGDQQRSQAGNSRPTRAVLVPRYPVVFCHGMLAFSMLKMRMPEAVNCFVPLRDFLTTRGVTVLFPEVVPTAGVVERAESLREQIRAWTSEPVNVIAHSMGGLDARHMVSRLGMEDQVKSLTMVSSPHRGTYLADWFLANYRQRVPLLLGSRRSA